jgi:general secretion pathway protein G
MNDPKRKSPLNCAYRLNDFARSEYLYQRRRNRGFTLIEVCIVIAIIATLSAIAVPTYIRYKYKAMVVVAISDIRMIEQQISFYEQENGGQLPNSFSDLTTIKNVKDPWGNPYKYLLVKGGTKSVKGQARKNMSVVPVNQNSYDLYSMGRDGKTNISFLVPVSQDDIVRAYDGQYVGLVSEI